jgi:hypothetical protein
MRCGWGFTSCRGNPDTLPGVLAPASSLAAAFLTALALFVARYHNRWLLGVRIAAVTFLIPYIVGVVLLLILLLR